jgi:hypothetical protein
VSDAPGCREHDTLLYLESYQPQTNEEIRHCPEEGCPTERRVVVRHQS